MSDKQNQNVEAGGQAVQAHGDVVIYEGMSPKQMSEIMIAIASQLSVYQAEAMSTAKARFEELRDDLLKEFAEGKRANPEAFKEPDFQFAVIDAHKAYARSGDETLRGTLVDMVSRRSLEPERSRLAITLDDAIVKTAALSSNEFAELSLVYLVVQTRSSNINNFQRFCEYVNAQLIPFVRDATEEESSYLHLESQGCVSIIPFTAQNLIDIWKHIYAGVMGKGVDKAQLESQLPPDKKELVNDTTYFVTCLHDASKLQPNAISLEVFLNVGAASGLSKDVLTNIWNQFSNTVFNEQELPDLMRPLVPEIDDLFKLWKNSPLQRIRLTTIGTAIGHANAVSKVGFEAPLQLWIK